MNSSHRRQSSNGSFTVSLTNDNNNLLQTSFTSLSNFMNTAKLMEDEIMVPSKLKDKLINHANTTNGLTNGHNSSTASLSTSLVGPVTTTNGNGAANGNANGGGGEKEDIDALEYYKFIRLVRNQFLHSKPFSNIDEYFNNNEFKNKKFKQIFESLCYHYTELMSSLNMLSDDAKILTDTYRENV